MAESPCAGRTCSKAPVFDRKAPVFAWEVPTFDQEAPAFDWEAPAFDRVAPAFDVEAPVFDWKVIERFGRGSSTRDNCHVEGGSRRVPLSSK